MTVELRNVQSGETFEVGPEGATFGREGGPASIRVPDASVSKRHARIFWDSGAWFLEDTNSSNGTVVEGTKLTAPLVLRPGLVFQMSKQRFEVVSIDGKGAGRSAPVQASSRVTEPETKTSGRQGGQAEGKKDVDARRRDKGSPPTGPEDDAPRGQGNAGRMGTGGGRSTGLGAKNAARGDDDDDNDARGAWGEDPRADEQDAAAAREYEPLGIAGGLFEGLAYLVKVAPALVVNPLRTARDQIENAPLPAVHGLSLAAIVLPAVALTGLLQALTTVAVRALTNAFSVSLLIVAPAIAVATATATAVFAGFLGHAVLSFVVQKTGGTSDPRTRTTHLALGFVATTPLAAMVGLSGLLGALVARFAPASPAFSLIVVVPALLGIVAWPVPFFVQWLSFRAYGVARWMQAVLAMGVLVSAVGGLAAAGLSIWSGVEHMKSLGAAAEASPTSTTTPPPSNASTATSSTARSPQESGSPEASPSSAPATGNLTQTPADALPTTKTTSPSMVPPPGTAVPSGATTPSRDTVAAVTAPTMSPSSSSAATPSAGTSTRGAVAYADYARKRARIEAVLDADPTLMNNADVATAYKALSQAIYRAEDAAEEAALRDEPRRKGKDPSLAAYVERLKRARVFEATARQVDALYRLLGEP